MSNIKDSDKIEIDFSSLSDEDLGRITQELNILGLVPIKFFLSKSVLANPLMTQPVLDNEGNPTDFISITFAYPIECSNVIVLTDESCSESDIEIITNKAIDFMNATCGDLNDEDTEDFEELDDEFIN